MAILPDLSAATREQLIAQIEAMRTQHQQRITFKVSEKGAVSCYGLGRFPVTLYATQWERLTSAIPALRQFMADNAPRLATKP